MRQVQQPNEYNRESWALNDQERLNKVPMLHGQGNKLFKQGLFEEATEKYKEAIVCLKNIQSKARRRRSVSSLRATELCIPYADVPCSGLPCGEADGKSPPIGRAPTIWC